MKTIRFVFTVLFIFSSVISDGHATDITKCIDKQYRQNNPEKCSFFIDDSAPIFSSATVLGGAIALLTLANTNKTAEASIQNSYVQPTLPSYNMVGGDVDSVHLSNTMYAPEYTKNYNQYNDIRLAYSLARGFTGKGSEIAVLDAGLDSNHGQAVAAIASGPIAPDATVKSYKIAKDFNFVSYKEIGNIINSASNADIFNASWSVSMSATALKSRNQLIQLTDKTFVDSLSAAATRDAIFVWAAGNDYRSQSSALSAMPIVMPELKGHFINVVAWDSETGALADYSNACGITKDYCITAPGTNIDTGKTTASGTSFAAPIVSAAIAVIREAFPYMTSPEITELLLTTARDLGTPGIDEIYGHGMLDLERATRPVGAALVPIDNGVMQQLQTARVSGNVAHKIKNADLNFAFFDDFGRAFDAKLSDNISIKNPSRALQKLHNDEEFASFSISNFEFGFKNNDLLFGDGFLKTNDKNIMTSIGTYNEKSIGNLTFFQRTRFGISALQEAQNSMITGFSNIYTTSLDFGARLGAWTISLSIPDNIIFGKMNIRLPIGRADNRDIIYKDYTIDLFSKPSIEYSVSYKSITAGFVDNPYGTDEIFILTKGKIAF